MSKAQRKEKEVPQIGGNISGVKEALLKYRDEVIRLKEERAVINADITAIMERAEAEGIPKKAFRAALNYYESSPEQREGYHDGYTICLEAWGMPMNATQAEFFDENTD